MTKFKIISVHGIVLTRANDVAGGRGSSGVDGRGQRILSVRVWL